eukprot:CAMPEP_0113527464 /NCGR_PEP_ID=MMETSP0015_2-20120614/1309_1 /TAXON_ID=2838 /ORGANISM="Odontella" /LENGTH=323 /DNA_ID=CAMNT_0000425899 /DNA_START=13 /DNA_END=984 /DNA_ORIENTATION=- /assembly_acc=CAM_ASM_000160
MTPAAEVARSTRTAVVVGGAAGIGAACARRLAKAGFSVVAVGRGKPGRSEEVVASLDKATASASEPAKGLDTQKLRHEFRECDAFSLKGIKECAAGIVKDHGSIDAVFLSQGMATTQGFTPTKDEGNDEKLTLHFWSRAAMSDRLLPSLRKSTMPSGPVVVSILSGGVHKAYDGYKDDPELRNTYSIPRAADMAGYYNDLFFDALARRPGNDNINFVHASPGFVNSNWGSEFPWYLRSVVRCMQPLGKSTDKCAEFMCQPALRSAAGEPLMERPDGASEGVFIMNEDATPGKLTKGHTSDAVQSVWDTTADVLKKSSIDINES